MSDIFADIPTEPGLYLFCGSRGGVRHDFRKHLRPEVVRVYRNGGGKLTYIGEDFFHHPKEAVGAWMRIDVFSAALAEQAQNNLLRHVARTQLPSAFKGRSIAHRGTLIEHLCGFGAGSDEIDAANKIFDVAIALGVVEASDTGPYPYLGGWWQLVSLDDAR